MSAERAERIGRAAAEHHRHVDAAGDRDIGARALLAGNRRRASGPLFTLNAVQVSRGVAVDLGRQLGAGDGDQSRRR